MAVTMSMAGYSTHCRRGGFAVRWLLALHIRLVEQGKLAAAVALQLPSRILKAAVKDTTALAPRQALFCVGQKIKDRKQEQEQQERREQDQEQEQDQQARAK